eukprot:SAG11_NODE_4822_length_1754_cov_1.030816_1_plen_99_part_10
MRIAACSLFLWAGTTHWPLNRTLRMSNIAPWSMVHAAAFIGFGRNAAQPNRLATRDIVWLEATATAIATKYSSGGSSSTTNSGGRPGSGADTGLDALCT